VLASFLARDVSPAPSGWGLALGGTFLIVGGVLLGIQARSVRRTVDPSDRWRGLAGMFSYMGALGVFVALPIGAVLLVIGLTE
jgi:uncharacterized membrane protein HdeD (DUF308 family)